MAEAGGDTKPKGYLGGVGGGDPPPLVYPFAIIYFSLSNIIFISYLMWYFTVQFKL